MPLMVVRRIAIAIPLLLLVSFAIFALTALSTTDPARTILGEGATPEAVAKLHKSLGLDQPLIERYWHWLTQLFSGSLGNSWYGDVPVTTKIGQGLPVTIVLVLSAVLLTALVAMPLGLYAGLHAGGKTDRIVSAIAGLFLAIPEFWLALLLILVLSVKLKLLPGTGAQMITGHPWFDFRHFVLPVVAIALPQTCALFRQTRASAAATAEQDFVRTARAGGISDLSLLRTHIAKNALVPSVTLLGLQIGRMIGIAAVVESVCGMYGLGSIAVQAALGSDLPIVVGVVLITAAVVMASNLLADVTVHVLAPRTRKA